MTLYSLAVLRDFLQIRLFHIACYCLGFIYPTLHVFYLEIKIRINMFELRFFKHNNLIKYIFFSVLLIFLEILFHYLYNFNLWR